MVQLWAECGPLVAAAAKLPREAAAASAKVGGDVPQGQASQQLQPQQPGGVGAASHDAAVESLRADARALTAGVPRMIAALTTDTTHRIAAGFARCRRRQPPPSERKVSADGGGTGAIAASHDGGGHVYVSGIGKSGAVAHRIALSLRSVGVRASWVGGSDWAHGDYGGLGGGDVVILLSNSGKAAELVHVAQTARQRGALAIAVTGHASSPLAQACEVHMLAPGDDDLLSLVPTRSIVCQEAAGNALVGIAAAVTALTPAAFRADHPGGAIGRGSA
jgi:D-arabinose 5-phosphate isomerase GutQ